MTHSEQSFPEPSRQDGVLGSRASELEGMRHSGTKLSIRERMIVILMSSGLSNKEIARHLYISPETVKSHAKSIFWKLAVRSRAQAVYLATSLGLI